MATERDDTFDLPPGFQRTKPARRPSPVANAITVAMLSSEDDVELGDMRQLGSIVSNLLALNVGECYTRSRLVDDNVTMASLQKNLTTWKNTLRQTVNQAMRRARESDNRELTLETSQSMTLTGKIYIQVIVTRTA